MTAEIVLTGGLVALVDDSDAELVANYRWRASPEPHTTYAQRSFRVSRSCVKSQAMHTLITGFPITDHINGNGLDNRRSNLRRATVSQNQANRRKSLGRSRFKGVCWNKMSGKWQAAIETGGRKRYLGVFVVEEEAALAYDTAAREIFQEFAAVNFPQPGERGAR